MTGKTWKRIHLGLVFTWLCLWFTAAVTGWINSVAFVSHMSMAALVLGSLSAWQGAKTEEKQDEEIEKNNERDNKQDEKLTEL